MALNTVILSFTLSNSGIFFVAKLDLCSDSLLQVHVWPVMRSFLRRAQTSRFQAQATVHWQGEIGGDLTAGELNRECVELMPAANRFAKQWMGHKMLEKGERKTSGKVNNNLYLMHHSPPLLES